MVLLLYMYSIFLLFWGRFCDVCAFVHVHVCAYSFIYLSILVQFYIPFKISSTRHIRRANQSRSYGAKTGEPREKSPGTPSSRTWLISHVPSVCGLEPTTNRHTGEIIELSAMMKSPLLTTWPRGGRGGIYLLC